MKYLLYFVGLIVFLFHFSVIGSNGENQNFDQDSSSQSLTSDSKLKVLTRFPRYRIYYDHTKVAQEVRDAPEVPEEENILHSDPSLKEE